MTELKETDNIFVLLDCGVSKEAVTNLARNVKRELKMYGAGISYKTITIGDLLKATADEAFCDLYYTAVNNKNKKIIRDTLEQNGWYLKNDTPEERAKLEAERQEQYRQQELQRQQAREEEEIQRRERERIQREREYKSKIPPDGFICVTSAYKNLTLTIKANEIIEYGEWEGYIRILNINCRPNSKIRDKQGQIYYLYDTYAELSEKIKKALKGCENG